MNSERDQHICHEYVDGAAIALLRLKYDLSAERVRQILRKAGVYNPQQQITTDREKFLGVNISEPVKTALKKEAERRGMSMSALTSDVLKDMLEACGYPVEVAS